MVSGFGVVGGATDNSELIGTLGIGVELGLGELLIGRGVELILIVVLQWSVDHEEYATLLLALPV